MTGPNRAGLVQSPGLKDSSEPVSDGPGVVHARTEPPRLEMYFTAQQYDRVTLWLMVRFRSGDPLDHARGVRAAVWSVDGTVPVPSLLELSDVMRSSTRTTASLALLLSLFAGLTVVLGAVSVFTVTSLAVHRRRAEYGVRIALGGSSWDILRSSVTACAAPAGAGTVVGRQRLWLFPD